MVTEDKKKYYLGFEDLPFSEDNLCAMLSRYKKEDDDWHDIHGLPFHTMGALVRGDIYENFNRIARDENLVKEKVDFGYYNLSDIVGLALGTESLERINYICSVRAQEKEVRLRKERNEERERNKFLPEHLVWKPMHKNNMKANSVFGEYALLITRKEEKLVAMEFKIVFQEHMKKPMLLDIAKGTEYYVLFEKTDHDFYGPIDYPSPEDKWGNSEEDCRTSKHESSFFDRYLSGNKDMGDYGRFLRAFSTEEAAKEYAVFYANANSHIIGDRNSLITHLDSEEDHRRRVERYEAYQAYRKYYKEIMNVVVNYDAYPDFNSGGGAFLKYAILKEVPQLTERQLMYFWEDIPRVLEKRTQDVIEMERQRSIELLQKMKSADE